MWYEFNEDNTKVLIKHPKQIGVRWIRDEEVPDMLLDPDNNPNLNLVKIDKNGTKYYKTDICPSCNGCGKVHLGISDNNEYICNKCEGVGKLKRVKTYKIHTHEYGKVLEKEYMEKQNKKFYDKYGINQEDDTTYVYLGNTYPIKNELKEKGAKYDNILGWHSKDLIEGYPYIKVTVPIRIYPDKSIGYDYGYVGGNSHAGRENYDLDNLKALIRKANKDIELNSQ